MNGFNKCIPYTLERIFETDTFTVKASKSTISASSHYIINKSKQSISKFNATNDNNKEI